VRRTGNGETACTPQTDALSPHVISLLQTFFPFGRVRSGIFPHFFFNQNSPL